MTIFAGYVAAAVIAVAGAVLCVGLGVRMWRDVGRPLSYWLRTSPFHTPEGLAGLDRASLMEGVGLAFLAAGLVTGAVAGPRLGAEPDYIVVVVAISGALLSFCLVISIMFLNQPKFLVPPHLRAQPGILAFRRRERHSQRAGDSPPAGRR